jgi:protease PrsW
MASRIVISLLPVFLLALALVLMDGYKLVKWPSAAFSLFKGGVAAAICLLINLLLMRHLAMDLTSYSRYVAPFIEEAVKAALVFHLIQSKRIGFLVDAAIHGAAIGAGFALVENSLYLKELQEASLLVWYIRGFGTALMHAACSALFGILCKRLCDRQDRHHFHCWWPALLAAVAIHSLFNHFFLPPIFTTLTMVLILPPLIVFVYENSERSLRVWLNMGMDEDMAMLEMILTGRVNASRFGQYLHSLRRHFTPTVLVDLLCYLRIYLELAIRAKGMLLLRQNGIASQPDAAIKEKFAEFKYLEKSIGKTGKLALAPFMRLEDRELWQLYMLGDVPASTKEPGRREP